jgi:hypothetical protein
MYPFTALKYLSLLLNPFIIPILKGPIIDIYPTPRPNPARREIFSFSNTSLAVKKSVIIVKWTSLKTSISRSAPASANLFTAISFE